MEMNIALFILGMGVGIALHRFIMALALNRVPDDLCSYCEWLDRKKRLRKKR